MIYAWIGDVPQDMRDALWGQEPALDMAYAHWDSGWKVDVGLRRYPGTPFEGQPVIGRSKKHDPQPYVWDGWCLMHTGVIRRPERLWIGRVPVPSWALLKRLAWVGSSQAHESAVRKTMQMLSDATVSAHVALVGDPLGHIYIVRLDGDVERAGVLCQATNPCWAIVTSGSLADSRPVETGVTPLRETSVEVG